MDTKPSITNSGVTVQTFSEVYQELASQMRAIYGVDIDLAQNTPDGQRLGIETKMFLDLQTFGLALYNYLDPDFAPGEHLNRIIKLCGIRRKPKTRSIARSIINVEYPMTLKKGYVVADVNNIKWVTVSEYNLKTGDNEITLFAQEWGKIDAITNTINKPISIILGVNYVRNIEPAIPGRDEETDEELRLRRNKSLENAAYSTIGGLYAKLADLQGVRDVVVYENVNEVTDTQLNLKPHSYWVIIDGGDNAQIAETIARNKTAGAGMKGNVEVMWLEELSTPDGSPFYYTHTARWDRPKDVMLHIRMKVRRREKIIPIDVNSIKKSIVKKTCNIAENIVATEMYAYAYSEKPDFTAIDLQLSKDGKKWFNNVLEAKADERFIIKPEYITIEEIPW